MNIKQISAPLINRRKIAKDTYELTFGLEGQKEKFEFIAGQSIVIFLDKKFKSETKKSRQFSILNSPTKKNCISIAFRLPNPHSEFKEELMKMPIGSIVKIIGPSGKFTLPEETSKEITFIAGGIGIVPFLSMINYSTSKKTNHKINLLYTDKSEESIIYYDKLVKLEEKNNNFSFIHRFKRINKTFLKRHANLKYSLFYLCGKESMIRDVKNLLIDLKVKPENILTEEYNGYT